MKPDGVCAPTILPLGPGEFVMGKPVPIPAKGPTSALSDRFHRDLFALSTDDPKVMSGETVPTVRNVRGSFYHGQEVPKEVVEKTLARMSSYPSSDLFTSGFVDTPAGIAPLLKRSGEQGTVWALPKDALPAMSEWLVVKSFRTSG